MPMFSLPELDVHTLDVLVLAASPMPGRCALLLKRAERCCAGFLPGHRQVIWKFFLRVATPVGVLSELRTSGGHGGACCGWRGLDDWSSLLSRSAAAAAPPARVPAFVHRRWHPDWPRARPCPCTFLLAERPSWVPDQGLRPCQCAHDALGDFYLYRLDVQAVLVGQGQPTAPTSVCCQCHVT